MDKRFCVGCGKEVDSELKYCGHCGKMYAGEKVKVQTKKSLSRFLIIAIATLAVFIVAMYFVLSAMIDLPPYSVVSARDISIAGETRVVYDVIVSNGTSERGLLLVFRNLDKKTFDNMTIFFYGPEDDTASFFTIGKAERATKKSGVDIVYGSALD